MSINKKHNLLIWQCTDMVKMNTIYNLMLTDLLQSDLNQSGMNQSDINQSDLNQSDLANGAYIFTIFMISNFSLGPNNCHY